jgi:hypothetical protein
MKAVQGLGRWGVLFVGPSLQVRTSRSTPVTLTPLFGVQGETAAKIFLNAGWEF